MITNYEPYTFERVFESLELCEDYGIFDKKSPADYGFAFESIDFASLDSTALNGWYLEAKKPSSKCFVLLHGRTSNRLKTMKYLSLIDSLHLNSVYNVFIPDLRNSGLSAPAKTYMGYRFGEDVTSALIMLHDNFRQDTVLLYAFSMGAMAVCNALGRPELSEMVHYKIVIEKIIFDSPLVNVKETLREQFSQIPVVDSYFDESFSLYSKSINEFGEQMRLSRLLPKNIPLLILQSMDDKTTGNGFLDFELAEMKDFHQVKVIYFRGPGHVKIFQEEHTRQPYLKAVGEFLEADSFRN